MHKLVIAIVHHLDADNVVEALEEQGHRLTRIPSFGGFLGLENSTLLLAVEDDVVPSVLGIIEMHCSSRDVELPLVVVGRLKDELPGLVRHGGATVLIADLRDIVRF